MTSQTEIKELAEKAEHAKIIYDSYQYCNVFNLTIDQRLELAQKKALAQAEKDKTQNALDKAIKEYSK